MKKKWGYKICYGISILAVLGFVIEVIRDYIMYTTTLNSAPISVFILVDCIFFLVPAVIFFIIGLVLQMKKAKPRKVKWIFFDVGTTLVDETEAYNHRIRNTIAGTDITFEQFQEKRLFFAKQNLKGDLEAFKFFGLTKTPWCKEDEVPYPDAEAVLQYLREKGYKIGVIANQSLGTAERLANWGLLKYIDVVAASAELGVSKPDKEIFEHAFAMAGCTAREAVMVGDRLDNDIFPAKNLGMQTVWMRQGVAIYQDPTVPGYEPDYIADNLSALKGLF